ncbi:MAG: bifunctional ADP-dependent NAD(P)H-hydrate dehydratase/NAD(P)H-hydrate epimerase [Treponema sp.]|jgi:NAD(P)H-hydrate epimerase|nr:bifunctional ADP-dependent NAD(P)H-hydrate dehydratase/NAD(P)H-hydrate epimerase [Treponema sp.]
MKRRLRKRPAGAPGFRKGISEKLVSAENARALDAEASAAWGLDSLALVEAAGRNCARVFVKSSPRFFKDPALRITAMAGSGNNGADALVMLRALILGNRISPANAAVVINRMPGDEDRSPRSLACRALERMEVPFFVWEADPLQPEKFWPVRGEQSAASFGDPLLQTDIIIDGIAGTGIQGPLEGKLREMVRAINALGYYRKRPFVVSIDVPSGNSDAWERGMPILEADATLGIEPLKAALYKSAARPFGGTILPVGEIFPRALIDRYEGTELLRWETVQGRIPAVRFDSHKYERGLAEIRAGCPGSTGAARIAARGAQAAGAGLVRLLVDEAVYPVLAVSAGGVMVVPAGKAPAPVEGGGDSPRFRPDALLLGPGWGRSPDRALILEKALAAEAAGTPLILDADAIHLARDCTFRGRTILTPHPGEFAAWSDLPGDAVLNNPFPILAKLARERGAVILLKGHVLYVASPDGRLGVLDGMAPVLSAGGTGDLLAGFCVALAARMAKSPQGFDAYTCAAAAAALLLETGRSPEFAGRFIDPLELADRAAALAGAAWLPEPSRRPEGRRFPEGPAG